MNMRKTAHLLGLALLVQGVPFAAAAEDFTNAIAAYLQQYVHAQLPHGCLVVGLVDEHGPRVISCGDLDNGTDRQADGDTLFGLHSATGLFPCLLLQDMVERGEMQPDEPVAKYLPASVKMPTYKGQPITLRHLAKETSGLGRPPLPEALEPKRADTPLAGFTADAFYALVSNCQLTSAPGTTHWHPSMDRAVLNQALAWKTGMDYESLLTARILRPLHMHDTGLALTPEQQSRLASEHNKLGYAIPRLNYEDFKPAAVQYSTANDLLKFLSACGLTSSALRPLWDHTVANFAFNPQRAGMLHTGGGFACGGCWIAFDKARRRGVVVLATSYEPRRELGNLLLESEWQADRRPEPAQLGRPLYAAYAGQYQRAPGFALGLFALRHSLLDAPRKALLWPAGICLAGLVVLLGRAAGHTGKRRLLLGWAVLAGVLLAWLLPVVSSRLFCARLHPGIGIRSEGERLFAQPSGSNLCSIEDWPNIQAWGQNWHPIDVWFPPVPVELLPQSESRFFERLSGVPITFSRDAQGKVTGLTLHYHGRIVSYDRISEAPPEAPEPVKRPALVKLDPSRLEACVGPYEVAPGAVFPKGMKLTVWREGEQLLGRVRGGGESFLHGAFALVPQSETNFLEQITGAQFRFLKNAQGQITAVLHHPTGAGLVWFPEWEAKRASASGGTAGSR